MQFIHVDVLNDSLLEDYLALKNTHFYWTPFDMASTIYDRQVWPKEHFSKTLYVLENGRLIAGGSAYKAFWLTNPPTGQMMAYALPGKEVAYQMLIEQLVSDLHAEGFNKMTSFCSDEWAYQIPAIEQLGFQHKMSNPTTHLDVTTFDRLQSSCVEVQTYADYKRNNPNTWDHDLWRLEMDILSDVPLAGEFHEDTLELWNEDKLAPNVNFETIFVALIDGKPVGMSEIQINRLDSSLAMTGLTGVRRQFRRKGIARELKIHAIRHAKTLGVRDLYTDNEENNPMLQLNFNLGFRHKFNLLAMIKEG